VSKVLPASLVVVAILAATILPSDDGEAQTSAPAPASNDGVKLYQAKCGGCHSIAANKIGPAHKGVFGRKAAVVAGYNYSPALRAAKITWDAKTLDQWLQGPQKLVKGSRMYLVVPDPAQRAAIIAFLQSDAAR
jgi:cytochrome c